MARKFNVGDTVEVMFEPDGGVEIGHRGKISYREGFTLFPYLVTRRCGISGIFTARELKLIKRKIKNKGN